MVGHFNFSNFLFLHFSYSSVLLFLFAHLRVGAYSELGISDMMGHQHVAFDEDDMFKKGANDSSQLRTVTSNEAILSTSKYYRCIENENISTNLLKKMNNNDVTMMKELKKLYGWFNIKYEPFENKGRGSSSSSPPLPSLLPSTNELNEKKRIETGRYKSNLIIWNPTMRNQWYEDEK